MPQESYDSLSILVHVLVHSNLQDALIKVPLDIMWGVGVLETARPRAAADGWDAGRGRRLQGM